MALSTTQYGYIIDPMVPFTDEKGKTIKNGFVRVFVAGSSTPVVTYRNFDGAANQDLIELDNSGRVKHNVIGSKGSLYKVVVYDAHHSQETPILTVDKIAVLGASINATGATIVTGLDSVTVPEENFLKATVEGTGVELALDPTEVTSEVSTTAAAVTAAADYVVPLLDKTGEGDSNKISLANLFKFALDWISRLATTITSFASGDFIAVSNPTDGSRKMSKDTLLQLTSQNALAGNVAQEFVPNVTNAVAGIPYVYGGKLYVAKENYNGSWDASMFIQVPFSDLAELSPEYSVSGAGDGTFYVNKKVFGIQEGRRYRIYVIGSLLENGESDTYQFILASYKNDVRTIYYSQKYPTSTDIRRFVDFTAVSNDYVEVGFRAPVGEQVKVLFVPITERNYDGIKNVWFIPNGNVYSQQLIFNTFIVGHTYRLIVKNPDFSFPEGLSSDSVKLSLEAMNINNQRIGDRLVDVRMPATVDAEYTFTIPEGTNHVMFGGRSTTDIVIGYVEDITDCLLLEDKISKTNADIECSTLSPLVISTESFENTGMSAGYPTHSYVSNRVVQNDLIVFPSSKLKVKIFAPRGVWMYFVSYSSEGGWKKYLGYPDALRNGDTLDIDCTEVGDYAYRLVFGRDGNGALSVSDMAQYVNDGLFKIMANVDPVNYATSVQLVRSASAKKKLISASPWCKELPTFVHVSDLHGDAVRLRNAVIISEKVGADALLCSGDSAMYNGADGTKFQVDVTKNVAVPFLFAIGNHESRPTGVSTLFADNIAGLVTNNGYLKSTETPADDCFYYKDFDSKKIRVITLNYYHNGVYNGSLGQTQLDWFVARLLDTPEGYGIIVMLHSPEDAVIISDGKSDFYQSERVVSYQENGFYIGDRPVMNIIDAFIGKTNGTEAYTDNGTPVSVSYDFRAVSASTEFVCYVAGHRHEDWVGKYRDSSNLQICLGITTGSALNSMFVNAAWSNQSDLGRGDGRGLSQDAVNIYSIDRDNGVIRITRVGADISTQFEKRECMAIPYKAT